ncbi:MAG: type II toxin-antitoxin system VapC family toxin [Candidatus Udaeobacter sp.]
MAQAQTRSRKLSELNALIDSDVLLDFLDGYRAAAAEIARYRECCVSIISWMELLAGARTQADEDVRREFLAHFRLVPLTPEVAEEAVALRRKYRLKLPDAIIWASAINENCVLVSRNTKDFPAHQPGVRFPYRR